MNKLEGIKEIILNTNMSDEVKLAAIKGIIDNKEIKLNDNDNFINYIDMVRSKFNLNSNNKWIRYTPTEVSIITGISDFKILKSVLSLLGVNQRRSNKVRYYMLPSIK